MKPDIKERWIAALTSGQYTKTKYIMKDDQGFCCLGVLCDKYANEHGITMEELFPLKLSNFRQQEAYETTILPVKVREWSGLIAVPTMNDLAIANDQGETFPIDQIKELE